jgi:DNA-binding response OmpR family regulator
MRNPNRIYSSQELAKLLWPSDNDTTAETVRSWMRNLRTKIGTVTDTTIIKTIPKSGYLIEINLP